MTLALPGPSEELEVVLACVDGRTRAAMADHLLRQALAESGTNDIRVTGVGGHKTRHPDEAITKQARSELLARGIVPIHRPRPALGWQHLAKADVILTFEHDHRVEMYQYAPRMLKRCFTLTELAAIAVAAPDLQGLPRHDRIEAASRQRRLGACAPDVPATWQQPDSACSEAAQVIADAVPAVAMLLK